jgi:hypothetical protein
MKISSVFPSKYLRAADLQDRQIEVVIQRAEMENFGDDDRKAVLYFKGRQKGLVLNKVNGRTIARAYGDDTDGWENKKIILFTAIVDFRGDSVEAIRVKIPKAGPPPGPTFDETEDPSGGLDGEVTF